MVMWQDIREPFGWPLGLVEALVNVRPVVETRFHRQYN